MPSSTVPATATTSAAADSRRELQRGCVSAGLGGPHEHHHPNVVVQRHRAVEDADHGQADISRVNRGAEHRELRHEAGRRRQPGQRQHENQHRERGRGIRVVQPGEVLQLVATPTAVAKRSDDGKRPELHEHVGDQVDERGGEAARRPGHDPDEDVTALRH